jgi:hypothetical protein
MIAYPLTIAASLSTLAFNYDVKLAVFEQAIKPS